MMHSLPLASSKEVILWLGENPCSAPIREALPPERAPRGRAPVGVRPLSCKTCSDSSLQMLKVQIKLWWLNLENTDLRTENTLAIFPIARILFLMTSFLTWAWPEKLKESVRSFWITVKLYDWVKTKRSLWCVLKIVRIWTPRIFGVILHSTVSYWYTISPGLMYLEYIVKR